MGFIILIFYFVQVEAKELGVAKIMMIKGEAQALSKNGLSTPLQKDQWVIEGQILKTGAKSFVKLLFVDKSQMNLGPESQMEIAKFPKESAGVINLLSGSLRSKVSKDYRDNQETDKSKLIVKTKTAAMGVRGTDFQVSFDPKTEATGLDVWEGQVSMAKIEQSEINLEANAIDNILNNEGVAVTEGSEVLADPKSQAPLEIRPMPADKIEAGKTEEIVSETNTNDKTETKIEAKTEVTKISDAPSKNENMGLRDIIPPGVPKATFTNEAANAGASLQGVVSSSAITAVEKQVTVIEGQTPNINRAPASSEFSPLTPPLTSTAGVNPAISGAPAGPPNSGTLSPPPPSSQFFDLQQQINNNIVQTQTQNSNTIIQNNIGNIITSDVTFTVIAN